MDTSIFLFMNNLHYILRHQIGASSIQKGLHLKTILLLSVLSRQNGSNRIKFLSFLGAQPTLRT